MRGRGLKVSFVAVITMILVLSIAGVAYAQWSDLTLSILGDYGITEEEVAMISDGYPDGTWKPYQTMPRRQFVKMAVDTYGIPLVTPATPTYTDVPKTSIYYPYVEAATAAGLTNGIGGGLFDPDSPIAREQALAIIARWVAQTNGFDLENMYTEAEIDALLGQFGDASAVSPSLREEMAFSIDFGITVGDAFGNLVPKKNLTRIQGAAMLIRSLAIIPDGGPSAPPAEIVLLSDDEQENLIGLTEQYTFRVNDEDGDPVAGALVDFDTLTDAWYVGNIQPEAALSDENGEVTVNLLSTEIGVQRVSAATATVPAIYATKYWVAIDEVYILDDDLFAQNNAGTEHEWQARVIVFGPGPLSTSRQDFYNAILPDADPTPGAFNLPEDGEPFSIDSFEDELALLDRGYVPRTMAGIPVQWSIFDLADDPTTIADETIISVGEFVGGGATFVDETDAEGLTTAVITSDVTGTTLVSVVADYVGNPYPGLMVNRSIYRDVDDYWDADEDWEPQPSFFAEAEKVWIPHIIGDDESPITPNPIEANLGEEFILTITLEDVFGNPVAGRQVEWFMQGIGHFVTDDENTRTDPNDPAGNRDIDVTDAAGQARVMVKSLEPGEQIVHAKVRDKGVTGEGAFITYDAEVQWFDVDVATFDDPTTTAVNEAVAENPVGTTHDFTLQVFGLKLELDPSVDDPQQQTPFIDTDFAGASFDGIFDARDAQFLGGILLVNDGESNGETGIGVNGGNWPFDANNNGVIDANEKGTVKVTVQGREITISGQGGFTRFDFDLDGTLDDFEGETGIYLPLEGKDVTFSIVDSLLGAGFPARAPLVASVGQISPLEAVTDENGEAVVTVSSNLKGPQTVRAIVDWEGNPHNGPELARAFAKKAWIAGEAPELNITVEVDGVVVADNSGEVATVTNPLLTDPETGDVFVIDPETEEEVFLNTANIEVHVRDQFGNDLPDYEVVYLLENIGTLLPPGQAGTARTYLPLAFFDDLVQEEQDQNATNPDHDEPTPAEDPFGVVVGPGGTPAFYFNQWYGAGIPGTATDYKVIYDDEIDFEGEEEVGGQSGLRKLVLDFGNGNFVSGMPLDLAEGLLATDGAKAWTRNGFLMNEGVLEPNGLTGSNVDLVLSEDPRGGIGDPQELASHFKSIVKVMVYPPADGLVLGAEQNLVFHTQIHKVWEAPVPTTLTLTPASDVAIAGLENVTFTATLLDQFGDPVVGEVVALTGTNLEGQLTTTPNGVGPVFAFQTNAAGQVNFTWGQVAGDWGVQQMVASFDGLTSNTATVQWVLQDDTNIGIQELLRAFVGDTRITALFNFVPWDGRTLTAFLTPGSAAIGTAQYEASINTVIPTPTHTFVANERYYVNAASTNTDGVVNWVTDIAITENN